MWSNGGENVWNKIVRIVDGFHSLLYRRDGLRSLYPANRSNYIICQCIHAGLYIRIDFPPSPYIPNGPYLCSLGGFYFLFPVTFPIYNFFRYLYPDGTVFYRRTFSSSFVRVRKLSGGKSACFHKKNFGKLAQTRGIAGRDE